VELTVQPKSIEEIVITKHPAYHRLRRKEELKNWAASTKCLRKKKRLVRLHNDFVDREIYPVLLLLGQAGIKTEYSCAGVSVLDDPKNHSLYAYITLLATDQATAYIQFLIGRMRHRLLVTFEVDRRRYDLSSYYIQHNRSFCSLLYRYTQEWIVLSNTSLEGGKGTFT
jgi:hypothetical protein